MRDKRLSYAPLLVCVILFAGCSLEGNLEAIKEKLSVQAAVFTALTADGSATETTTKLTLTFDKDISELSADDITLNASSTGAVKGVLTKTGTGTYELTVTGVTASGEISVTVARDGYTVSGNPKTVPIHYYATPSVITLTLTGVTADGSATATTTRLTLTFNKDITDLTAGDIILNANATGVTKGALTKTGTAKYELAVTSITAAGEISISVTKTGYTVSGNPKTAQVYFYSPPPEPIPVTFNNMTADGSATATTTKVTLTFDKDVSGLSLADIALNSGAIGAVKGGLIKTGTGTYELTVTNVTAAGEISVTVTKTGYTISGNPKTAQVYFYSPPPEPIPVTFINMTADGSATATTTRLTLTFDKDIAGLSAGDITLSAGTTGAAKGTLSKAGTGVYDLTLIGNTAAGEISVTVNKTGYTISGNPKTAQVFFYSPPPEPIPVTFNNMTADGSAMATTTRLTLTFDKDIAGLAAGDITLSAGITGAAKGTLSKAGTGVYELAVTGIMASGEISVSVTKTGYAFTPASQNTNVFYIPVIAFADLEADGSAATGTTKLMITFDKDIAGLAAGDITLSAGTTGAAKGTLSKTGTGVYELTVTGIIAAGEISMSVTKYGYIINPASRNAAIYPPHAVVFTNMTANGSSTEATTKLTLTFDQDIPGLSSDDITLNAGITGAVKGAINRTGAGIYELFVTGISLPAEVSVSPTKAGYAFSPASRTAAVFCTGTMALTITFNQIADNAPSITGPTLYRVSSSGPTSVELIVDNPGQYDSISWRVEDTSVTGTGPAFTLSASNPAYNLLGEHAVTVLVIKGNAPYNKTVSFWVDYEER